MLKSEQLIDESKLPVSEFKKILAAFEADKGNCLGGMEDALMKEICVEDGMADLNLLSGIVDLYVYYPIKQKKLASLSNEIHAVLQTQKFAEL